MPSVKRLVWTASRSKPIGKAPKVHLIYLVEDADHRLLDDLIFQRRDAQRSLPSVGFRYVYSSRRLRSIRSPVHALMKTYELLLQLVLIFLPTYSVDSRCRTPL